MFQMSFLKEEWLDSLRTLQTQWGGKLDDGSSPTLDGISTYASLISQIDGHKVFLDRSGTYLTINLWGDWDLQLFLGREILHDRFLKSIGLEYELSLAGVETDTLGFNKTFLIKGAPPELVKSILSDSAMQGLVTGLEDFETLRIRNGLLRITYEFSYEEQIRSDQLNDRVKNLIKFVDALDADKRIPKIVRPVFVPPPRKKPMALDFNTRPTVFLVLLVELLFLAIFGNSVIKYFILYSTTQDVSNRNGALLVLIMFVIPLIITTLLTIRKLLALSTINSCGVTLNSTRIKPGDSVGFAVGLSALMTVKVKEIRFNVSANLKVEKAQGTAYSVAQDKLVYSKDYPLAADLVLEKGRPYVFQGWLAIPAEAVPSGVTKDVRRSVINALDRPEYYVETSEWSYRVDVKMDYFPDYYFEQEFQVYSS